MKIHLLSGGAAHGLVMGLAAEFCAASGCEIEADFGAVGAIKQRLIAGAAADLVILTQAAIAELERDGYLVAGSAVDIGTVLTGIAVRVGDPVPTVGDAAALRTALRAADAIYFPDPTLATAGIHFSKVLRQLGVAAELAGRIRNYPNGNAAMSAMAAHDGGRPIGCTQVTEIVGTAGVALAGLLPHEFELATIYTAAVSTRAAEPGAARELAALLAGDGAQALRGSVGFV